MKPDDRAISIRRHRRAAVTGLALLVLTVGRATAQDSVPPVQDPPAAVTVTDDPPPPAGFARLDGVFKSAVSAMEKVLFYRLGQRERSFIVYQPQSIFVRDRGSEGPFLKLNAADDYPAQQLAPGAVDLLAARGKLAPGEIIDGQIRNYRWGRVGTRPVEYIIIQRDEKSDASVHYGDKFVYDRQPDLFRKLSRMRGLPTDITVPVSVVEEWNAEGALAAVASPLPGQPAYLQRESTGGIPVVVAWLAAGSVFFTLYMGFFNVWGFRHAVDIVRGKYDNPAETGEVTHFQALSSALSGTIGLGNIAGVTIAMTIGGPGAFFWMLMSGICGMSMKFVECTLGLKYREVHPDGTVLGGPMRYLRYGLARRGLAPLGMVLSVAFTFMCMLASFGGGNMLQANQAGSAMLQMFQHGDLERLSQLNSEVRQAAEAGDAAELAGLQQQRTALQGKLSQFEFRFKLLYGVVLASLVGMVIIGGIRRIGAAAEKIVPSMCGIYMAACLYIILRHLDRVPEVMTQVFSEAFTGAALGGGLLGVLVVGVQRAAFSNEAGAGSAPIAHSAARTEEPIREGCVALLEPFIDTVVVCSLTALVILITGAWDNSQWVVDQGLAGSALTSRAFKEELSWFPIVLSIAVTLFAYSTIISWSYYGERSWAFLFGRRSTFVYKILAVVCVFVGTVVNLGSVLDFSDMMILSMAFPNILGILLLSGEVKQDLARYWARYRAGEFPTYR